MSKKSPHAPDRWRHGDLLRTNAATTDYREHAETLFLTSSFTFNSAADAAEKFSRSGEGYIYSRFSNPTVETLNRRVALIEDAECALSTASGMAAVQATVIACCQRGSRVLCGANVFGATMQLLTVFLAKLGVETQFVNGGVDSWRKAAADGADLLLLETPSNPMQEVADIAALADIAHTTGALLAVDNCFCAGVQQPLKFGADIVIHSATKYLDGQGRVLGGVIAGERTLLIEKIYPFLRAAGPSLSPFNAWVILKSLETLPLRLRAHSESALAIARWLEAQPKVRRVWHTALSSHPAHELAMRQQNGSGGGLVTFAVTGGQAAAWRLIDALTRFSITGNFGDVKSIVTHPATTTHRRLSPEDREKIGLTDEIIRLSIGIEPVDSLQEDLAQALAAV